MDAWYPQLPFEDTDRETYERMEKQMASIDVRDIVESTDHTNLQGELACTGGACEITSIDNDTSGDKSVEESQFAFSTFSG
jgi:hypothetical protein